MKSALLLSQGECQTRFADALLWGNFVLTGWEPPSFVMARRAGGSLYQDLRTPSNEQSSTQMGDMFNADLLASMPFGSTSSMAQ